VICLSSKGKGEEEEEEEEEEKEGRPHGGAGSRAIRLGATHGYLEWLSKEALRGSHGVALWLRLSQCCHGSHGSVV
jgi:hypothetical protein